MKYITDSKLKVCQERLTNEEVNKALKIASKFVVNNEDDSTCGNVRVNFIKGKAKLGSSFVTNKYKRDYEQISSALALYRTISLYKCSIDANRVDHYKLNWYVSLKHHKTNEILGLGEWKGGFQIFTSAGDLKSLSNEFIKDAEALLTLLVSQKCPIGYDGVVSGSVA